MDITNQLKDEYPCSKCCFSKRLSCNSNCQELTEWLERLSDVDENKNKIGVLDISKEDLYESREE